MYGPIGGSVGIGPQMNDSPAKLGEPCRSTQTQEQVARMEKELARLNELRDALEHALAPILRGESTLCAAIKNVQERSPLVPLAEAISRFCDQANATGNALEDILRRIEL